LDVKDLKDVPPQIVMAHLVTVMLQQLAIVKGNCKVSKNILN
jgi:hypothetical protein